MSLNGEIRMLSVSKAATDAAVGLIFFKRGERGEELANQLEQGLTFIRYLEKGKNALAGSSIRGVDLDLIEDYETLMGYKDGQFLFEHLMASRDSLESLIKETLGDTNIIVSTKKINSLYRLLNRIAMRYP